MTGNQRITAALKGEYADTTPVMLHNFMMAAREAGITMAEFRSDPHALARSFIQAVETYGYDGIIVDVDTVTLAGAAGVPIDYPVDEPARSRGGRLETLEEAAGLEPLDISTCHGIQVWLEATHILVKHFGDEITIRGNCDQCPFSLAAMIRGMDAWMMDLLDPDQEEHVHHLLRYATDLTVQFIRLMADTGAHMVSNGDSPAGPDLIAPVLYRKFALPYERIVAQEAHARGIPYVLHICGNTDTILDDMLTSGADGLELDYKTDATLAHTKTKDRALFIGNIDPSGVIARGTPELVKETVQSLLTVFSDSPRFILNAGCAIPPTTPPENLRALVDTARQFSRF